MNSSLRKLLYWILGGEWAGQRGGYSVFCRFAFIRLVTEILVCPWGIPAYCSLSPSSVNEVTYVGWTHVTTVPASFPPAPAPPAHAHLGGTISLWFLSCVSDYMKAAGQPRRRGSCRALSLRPPCLGTRGTHLVLGTRGGGVFQAPSEADSISHPPTTIPPVS